MTRHVFTEQEVRLAAERRLKYIGAAKVSIRQIQIEPPLPRDLDHKNLDRLRNIFRKNRCRRLDVQNHVPATVSRHNLAEALQKANVLQESLLTTEGRHIPRLEFRKGQLRGLHGRHRIQAGVEVLSPADRWWTVDLYTDDIGEELRAALVEEYSHQKKPTDGEVYHKIRQYEGEGNEAFRERWFVRLSPSNQERLDQLDNKKNRRLRHAFDRLLTIPGLWPGGMRISLLHRLIASGCVEEIAIYVDHILDFWSSLVVSDRRLMKKIDQDTVHTLQLLAPGKSRTDKKTACGLVLSGHVFAEFSGDERSAIWIRMKDFDGLIPSLYTFFEDFKYLESCAHCLKRLLGPSPPIYSESEEDHREKGKCIIQTSESTFRHIRATEAECLETGYQQVWLYAMRYYPLMPPDPKNTNDLLAKPSRAKPDPRAIYDMAHFAHQLGFRSPEIDGLLSSSPDHEIARSALLQARKPGRYRYDDQQFDVLVRRIVDCFTEAVPDRPGPSRDLLADSTVKAHARSGVPQTRTHVQDAPFLFLDRLHADVDAADTITSFFVRRCVFFAFLGKSPTVDPINNRKCGNLKADQRLEEVVESPLFVEKDGVPGAPGLDTSGRHIDTSGRSSLLRRSNTTTRQLVCCETDNSEIAPEPMDLDFLEPALDQDSFDQRSPSDGNHSTPRGSLSESVLEMVPSSCLPGVDPALGDAMSECTQISLDTVSLEWSQGERETGEEPSPDTGSALGIAAQTPIDPAAQQRRSSETVILSEESDPSRSEELEAFFDGLRRAQVEQEELEKRMESDRLNEELNLLYHNQAPVRDLLQSGHTQTLSLPTSADQQAEATYREIEHIGTKNADPNCQASTQQLIEIKFWSLERGQWNQSDCLLVDRSDPSPMERLARKYSCKGYTLYDVSLKCLRPAHCYPAATADDTNAIFLISAHEEKAIAATEGLGKEEKLISMAARVVGRAGER
ncbi:hypothetical protein N7481_008506 [Penicillium waksmanii]|uniref:uncharacterized protein n=1 Tax=Penicillium waksmanii TaxID=69791 RepID=UPI002548EF70|nr:uncharacterized protein N7481_008506 [Penicillium waksmanii]KAJ5974799.1 hypothetical protein N7481_008506 [Penicillium waksmanii]